MHGALTPLQICFLRIAGAALLFTFFHRFIRNESEQIAGSDRLRLILSAVFGIALNQILFFTGLNLTVPVDTAIINSTNPLMVFILSAFLIKQSFSGAKLLGIILGGLGATLLIVFSFKSFEGNGSLSGNLLILLNTLSWSIYLIIVKPLLSKYHPFLVMKWLFIIGFIVALPFTLNSAIRIDFSGLTIKEWVSLLYIVLGTTFLAYLFISFGLSKLSASVVSVYTYLQPLLVVLIGVLLMAKPISSIQIVAGMLVIVGIILVGRR